MRRQPIQYVVVEKKRPGCFRGCLGMLAIGVIVAGVWSMVGAPRPEQPSVVSPTPLAKESPKPTLAKESPTPKADGAEDRIAELTRDPKPVRLNEHQRQKQKRDLRLQARQRVMKQSQRLEVIREALAMQFFAKIKQDGDRVEIWVDLEFYTADFDTKQTLVSVVYAYYYPPDEPNHVIGIINNLNGKQIGTFNPKSGLEL